MSDAAIEAAARRIALYNNDYDGPDLQWQGYVDEAVEAVRAYLAAMEAEGWKLLPVNIDMEVIVAEDMRAMLAARPQNEGE